MALRTIHIGAVEDAFQWDDATTPFYSDGSTPVGLVVPLAPTVDNAVVRKVDLVTGAVNPLADLQYVVMALTSVVPNERKLTAGTGVGLADGGAGGNATISIGQAVETTSDVTFDDINATGVYKVDGTQVLSNQAAAEADLAGGATLSDVITKVNNLLAKLRTHGIIAT